MANVNQIVYLTKAQYAELVRNGSITVSGVTVTYDQNNIYITPQGEPVTDLHVGGTSVPVLDGVANVPLVSGNKAGVIIVGNGLAASSSGILSVQGANRNDASLKTGNVNNRSITPYNQDISTFYGLAKAAGADMKDSSNAVGVYTEDAKSSISEMLNGAVSVSGTTPSITAKAGVRYVCGEVSTLTIVVPESGIIDVVFKSGTTATVLTITPPTGQTMSWANGFDPTNLEASKTYEINIMDGHLGVGASWT